VYNIILVVVSVAINSILLLFNLHERRINAAHNPVPLPISINNFENIRNKNIYNSIIMIFPDTQTTKILKLQEKLKNI
jgi:hypothetical protein